MTPTAGMTLGTGTATAPAPTVYVLEGGAITVTVPYGMTLAKMTDAAGRNWWSIVPMPEGTV